MTRELILIPHAHLRIAGMAPIDPGYPKDYTAAEMRRWADDLHHLYRTHTEELAAWQTTPLEGLSEDQRRIVAVHRRLFGDPTDGIKGSLRGAGVVELESGRH